MLLHTKFGRDCLLYISKEGPVNTLSRLFLRVAELVKTVASSRRVSLCRDQVVLQVSTLSLAQSLNCAKIAEDHGHWTA